jgi:hypothetical protein
VCSNFGELVGKNIELIKTTRDWAYLYNDYINTSLMRKLGLYIHSLIFTKHFEIDVEREKRSRGEKKS